MSDEFKSERWNTNVVIKQAQSWKFKCQLHLCVVHTRRKLGQNAIVKKGKTDKNKDFVLHRTQSVRKMKSYEQCVVMTCRQKANDMMVCLVADYFVLKICVHVCTHCCRFSDRNPGNINWRGGKEEIQTQRRGIIKGERNTDGQLPKRLETSKSRFFFLQDYVPKDMKMSFQNLLSSWVKTIFYAATTSSRTWVEVTTSPCWWNMKQQ